MSTPGKVLTVVNVVLAIAFVILAATDYGRRRAWEFFLQAQSFQLNGLGIDKDEKDSDGESLQKLANKSMREQLGTTFSTQIEAVTARHDAVRQKIDSANDKKTEIVKYILPLARNSVEHYQIATAKPADFDKILGPEGPFETAFNEANKGGTAYVVRADAIAHFLFNTSAEPQDYQQTLAVVGLAAYARAAEAQATRLRDMTPEIEREIDKDRVAFVAGHRGLIDQIVTLDRQVRGLQETLAKHEEQLKQYQTLLAARRQDAADLDKRIAATKAAADSALAVQDSLEKQLFAADGEAARIKAENERLDKEIKTKELGR